MDREHERDRTVSRDQSSFTDAKRSPSNPFRLGAWIHEAERDLKETRSHVTCGNIPQGDPCRDLKARFDRDAEIIQGIRGMRREVWEAVSPAERLQSLNELEQRLAASQGRAAHRVYAVLGKMEATSQADLHMAGLERELHIPAAWRLEPQVQNQIISPADAHALGLAAGKRIRVDEAFVAPSWGSSDVRDIAEHIFKACRYAYQHAVVTNPERHPEASGYALQLLQSGYSDEARIPQHRERRDNQMAVFAWSYAVDMRVRVYGLREWESPDPG